MGGAPPEIRPTGDIAAWFRKLCTSPSGVLYEDTCLQVLPILTPTLQVLSILTLIHVLNQLCTCVSTSSVS
jgi:hypothetical protein